MKLFMHPHPDDVKDDNGVGQVIKAQARHLPMYGWEIVKDITEADVTACHVTRGYIGEPDVFHCHGLHWTGDDNGQDQPHDYEINEAVIDAVRRARFITVPSDWVAEPFRRDMRISPVVIPHGIELDAWQPKDPHESLYTLWNKNRTDPICTPEPAISLAQSGALVVSTFGMPDIDTMRLVGNVPHATMRELIRHAGIYLATTLETFGIGTLEAMAAGVPVLGYRWGGTAELVTHGVNGYLVEPGDTVGLVEGHRYILEHMTDMRRQAAIAAAGYDWTGVIERYDQLYRQAYESKRLEDRRVTVVIPHHNYGQYLPDALMSVISQTEPPAEVIVVDDGSTDQDALAVLDMLESQRAHGRFPREFVRVIRQQQAGVAAARNAGIAAANTRYIVCLDADDKLHPSFIAEMHPIMEQRPDVGVGYSGMMVLDSTTGQAYESEWPGAFSWDRQTTVADPPANCIPTCCMFRRDMWARVGGYSHTYQVGEDGDFWTRGLGAGFLALQVTGEPLYIHRYHGSDSLSRRVPYQRTDTWLPWMRDKDHPMASPAKRARVRSYHQPLVAVVIPVGPNHSRYLPTALESLLAQTYRDWHAIVVNDDPAFNAHVLDPYPFAKLLHTGGAKGASLARNLGLFEASAVGTPLVLWLDADDYLMPDALRRMVAAYAVSDGRYIYTDWMRVEHDGQGFTMQRYDSKPYSQRAWLHESLHPVTALMSTHDAMQVGAWDDDIPGWEDWEFYARCAMQGVCGVRLAEPLLGYRFETGRRRNDSLARKDELLAYLRDKFITEEGIQMGSCCGGSRAAQDLLAARRAMDGQAEEVDFIPGGDDMIRMRFIGLNVGSVTFFGNEGRQYRGGNNDFERFANVHAEDVDTLLKSGKWERVVKGIVTQGATEQIIAPPPVPGIAIGGMTIPVVADDTIPDGTAVVIVDNVQDSHILEEKPKKAKK